ncbi:unnamed protein product [Haemonchus placei]|uniref:ING domain-containing protein n=1 Tax=Haemonchus placei TaxID=6290 RepID=A0A0N4X7T3_HAEPC|nr:unnamed protein product [Haemonchus placei]
MLGTPFASANIYLGIITMDPRGEKLFELFTKNLRYVEECKSRLRSLNKKFDELTASDKKAELDAINV